MARQTTLPRSRQRTSVLCSVMGERYRVMANERALRKQSTSFREYFVFSFIHSPSLVKDFMSVFMPILWDNFCYTGYSIQLNKEKQWKQGQQFTSRITGRCQRVLIATKERPLTSDGVKWSLIRGQWTYRFATITTTINMKLILKKGMHHE